MRIGVLDSGQKIVSDGLQVNLDAAQLRSYPGTGGTWFDISGNGRNFTTNGTYSSSSGGALSFNGSNQFSDGPSSNSLGIGQNVTIEFVGNLTVAGGTQWGFWFGATGGVDRGISCHLNESGTLIFDTMGFNTGNGDRISYSPAPSVGTTNWYAFRYKNDATPYKHIFLNGTSVANSGTNTPTALSLNTDTVKVPGNQYSIWYNGLVFIFRVYNRALSDTELIQNYNAVKSRFGL